MTAFVLEGKERLDHVIALLPDERLARMLDVVAVERLWIEALDLLAHLGDAQLDRLGRLADGRDPAPFTGLVAASIVSPPTELSRALQDGAGWAINLAVAEWVIRRRPARVSRSSTTG